MRIILCTLTLFLICFTFSVNAQMQKQSNSNTNRKEIQPIKKIKIQKSEASYIASEKDASIVERPATLAQYKGGFQALEKWIQENMNLPDDYNYSGQIEVRITIDADGKVSEPVIINNILNADEIKPVLKMFSNMPNWSAALDENDKFVKTTQVIPVKINIK